jgi:hypothetical protein
LISKFGILKLCLVILIFLFSFWIAFNKFDSKLNDSTQAKIANYSAKKTLTICKNSESADSEFEIILKNRSYELNREDLENINCLHKILNETFIKNFIKETDNSPAAMLKLKNFMRVLINLQSYPLTTREQLMFSEYLLDSLKRLQQLEVKNKKTLLPLDIETILSKDLKILSENLHLGELLNAYNLFKQPFSDQIDLSQIGLFKFLFQYNSFTNKFDYELGEQFIFATGCILQNNCQSFWTRKLKPSDYIIDPAGNIFIKTFMPEILNSLKKIIENNKESTKILNSI